jgi:hypothetical protein
MSGTPPTMNRTAKWRFLAHFGAFWQGSVTDPQSRKQLVMIGRNNVYHRRKFGKKRARKRCPRPSEVPKVSKIAGLLRVRSLLIVRDLRARARYIAKMRENRASRENCEFLFEDGTKMPKMAGSRRVQFSRISCNLRAGGTWIVKTWHKRDNRDERDNRLDRPLLRS